MDTSSIVNEIESSAEALGLSIDELCAKAKVARSTVTRWKSEKTKFPNLGTYNKIKKFVERESKRKNIATGA